MRSLFCLAPALALALLPLASLGQGFSTAFPSSSPSPASTPSASLPPSTEVHLEEKPFAQLSDQTLSEEGQQALKIAPAKWKHAETPHFILHYRRVTEAQKVAREIEFTLWWVAKSLGAGPDRYARRSHVYIFEDVSEWRQFLATAQAPGWFASFAKGDELFLNVREAPGTSHFDFNTLAHETTHAVVARLYRQHWPIWLNEGFAEYCAGASIAARKNQTVRRHQDQLHLADMPLEQLFSIQSYPSDEKQVSELYQTSEKFVRFLFNELPPDRFVPFVDQVLKGADPKQTLLSLYGDQLKDWETFQRRYARFTK